MYSCSKAAGSVGEEEQMSQTPNLQRPMLNIQPLGGAGTSNLKHRKSNIFWRILDFVLAGLFIFAGLSKIFDLDQVMAHLQQLQFASALADLRNLSLASPAEFANGIDNFKILPWPVSVALAFYLPWLEIFCALGLVFRFLYRGALTLLIMLMVSSRCHYCCESSGTRYHLRLFRSRQPTLEFPVSSRDQSRNSSWVATFLFKAKTFQDRPCELRFFNMPINSIYAKREVFLAASISCRFLSGLVCCETKQTRYDS